MRLFRACKTLRLALVLVGVLVAYQAVCPSVCLAAHTHVAAAHACCPDTAAQDVPSDPADLPPCCEGHGRMLLSDAGMTVAPFPLQGVVALLSSCAHPSVQSALAVTAASHPLSSVSARPLYLLHNVIRT